jgi:hypothetical protein
VRFDGGENSREQSEAVGASAGGGQEVAAAEIWRAQHRGRRGHETRVAYGHAGGAQSLRSHVAGHLGAVDQHEVIEITHVLNSRPRPVLTQPIGRVVDFPHAERDRAVGPAPTPFQRVTQLVVSTRGLVINDQDLGGGGLDGGGHHGGPQCTHLVRGHCQLGAGAMTGRVPGRSPVDRQRGQLEHVDAIGQRQSGKCRRPGDDQRRRPLV